MKTKKIIIINAVLVVAVIVSLVINSAANSLRVVSSPNGSGVSPTAILKIAFSNELDSQSPYQRFILRPQAEGAVQVKGDSIEFRPLFRLVGNTDYKIIVEGVRSASGKYIERSAHSFKTGSLKLSSFEQSLPISGDGFSIELLETGHVSVLIFSSPTGEKEAAARKILSDGGVADERITVEKTSSSRY